jgi:hypothetical protein
MGTHGRVKRWGSAAAMVLATGLGASAGIAEAATARPACSASALTAALRRAPGADERFVRRGHLDPGAHGFACAGRWATAGEIVGARKQAVEITVVFHAPNARWNVVSRVGPCKHHLIPRRIYRAACESN